MIGEDRILQCVYDVEVHSYRKIGISTVIAPRLEIDVTSTVYFDCSLRLWVWAEYLPLLKVKSYEA